MRIRRCGIAASTVAFVFATNAFADPPTTKVEAARNAPSSSSGAGGVGSGGVPGAPGQVDSIVGTQNTRFGGRPDRMWSISAGLESHVVLVQTEPNDSRSRPDKLYNYLFLDPLFYPSPYDQIRADFGVIQHFTADEGETGFRWTDFVLGYTRSIPIGTEPDLPPTSAPMRGVLLQAEADVTAPSSLLSQERGIITVPRLRLYAIKAFADRHLVVTLNSFGEQYIVRYRTAKGGNPNPRERLAFQATADVRMPFHHPLSAGAIIDMSYVWYYQVDTTAPVPFGSIDQDQSQTTQQRYGAEAHVRYSLPNVGEISPTFSLAYAIGDNTVLHDGVQHLYFGYYRRASEVYASLSARY